MKKLTSIIIALVMVLSCMFVFASCGDKTPAGVKVIDIKLTEEEYAFAVQKGDAELLAQLNDFMAEIEANGKFDEIIAKYFQGGTPTAVKSADTMKTDGSQLIVATNAAFAPYEFVVGNEFAGIDIEILKLIADELDMEIVIKDMAFESVVTSIGKNGIDMAASGLTISPARAKIIDFSDPYEEGSYQVILAMEDDTTFDACTSAEEALAKLKELK